MAKAIRPFATTGTTYAPVPNNAMSAAPRQNNPNADTFESMLSASTC